jgi:hypothetical protein
MLLFAVENKKEERRSMSFENIIKVREILN